MNCTSSHHALQPLLRKSLPTLVAAGAAFAFFSCTGNLPPFFFFMAHRPRRLYCWLLLREVMPRPSWRTGSFSFAGAIALLSLVCHTPLCCL